MVLSGFYITQARISWFAAQYAQQKNSALRDRMPGLLLNPKSTA
jgi:hypothetical protein